MSYPINQKINPYQQQQQLQQQQVAMGLTNAQGQNVNVDTIAQNVGDTIENSNNIVTQTTGKEEKDQQLTTMLTLPIWFAISRVMERFNKACTTKVDANGKLIANSSLLDKVREFGDRLADNKILKSSGFQKVSNFVGQAKSKWENLVEKSPILYSVFKTPAKPKNSFPRLAIIGTPAEAANDATQAFNAFAKDANGVYDRKKLAILFGKDDFEANKKMLEKMCTDDYGHYKQILECCDNVIKHDPKALIELGESNSTQFAPVKKVVRDKIFGIFKEPGKKAYNALFGREIRFSEIKNKLEALKGNKIIDGMVKAPGKTALGRALPKAFLRVVEGLTNGTAGGKMAIAMQAMCFADAIVRTKNAKKGDKGKTFIESCVNDLSYYLLMPLGLGIMYGAGGLKYIGMKQDQVKAYREAVEKFNKNVDEGLLADKNAYNAAKQELKDMLKGSTKVVKEEAGKAVPLGKRVFQHAKNIIYRPLKAVGRVLTLGLETAKPYMASNKGALSQIGNFARNLGHKVKVKAGVFRFPLYLMAIGPFLVKYVVKTSDLIFGKPEKSVLDDEKDTQKDQHPALIFPEANQVQSQQPSLIQQAQQVQPAAVLQPLQYSRAAYNQTVSAPRQNLIDMYQTSPQSNSKVAMIPTEEPTKRRYIPSSVGVELNTETVTAQQNKANGIIQKMDKAEKNANKALQY